MRTESFQLIEPTHLLDYLKDGKALTIEIKKAICFRIGELVKPSFFEKFDRLVSQNEELRDFILNTFSLPEKAILRYFPRSNKIKVISENPAVNFLIKFEKEDLNEVRSLGLSSEDMDHIDLDFARSKDSIFLYKKESSFKTLKNFFNEKTIAAATVFLAGAISASSANLSNYIEHSKSKTNLSTRLIQHSDEPASYEFISSAISAIEAISGWDYKLIPLRKEIEKFVEKYSDGYASFLKNKKISSNIDSIDIFSQIKSLPNMSDSDENDAFLKEIADQIKNVSIATGIDYKIYLSIIKTESSFRQDVISSTGDFSLAQINYKKWDVEFKRLGLNPIDFEKLKTEHGYSIQIMGQILKILKKRHGTDSLWFARYHSSTPSLKKIYADKLNRVIKRLESEESERFYLEVNNLIAKINSNESLSPIPNIENFKNNLIKISNSAYSGKKYKNYAKN